MLLLILLVGTCTSILAQPPQQIDAPHYVTAAKELEELKSSLQENVWSMGRLPGPGLEDYRRHYVEIVHVIFKIASYIAHSCLLPMYEENYQSYINHDAPDAISYPDLVIVETKKLSKLFYKDSEAFQNLIKQTCTENINERDCDVVLDKIVHSDPKRYQKEASLFLEGGKAFKAWNDKNKEFKAVSEALEAHKYVIENPQKLKDVIFKLSDVIRIIDPLYPPHKLSC